MKIRVSRGRVVTGVGAILVIAGAVAVLRSSVGAALTKSKAGFVPVATDARVVFEPGAEAMALQVAAFLDTAIATVEAGNGVPFKEPFTVYVCATQKSLNEFMALPPGAPIRGTVLFGDVFLAPSAFDWRGEDLHRESLMHEMSHLNLRQNLGFMAHRGEIPPWFNEALADLVSGVGGEGIPRDGAVRAILEGPALRPDSTGNLWSLARAGNYGLPGPMLHAQSTMFIKYLRDRDPEGFSTFLLRVHREHAFARPFRDQFDGSVEELWASFAETLRAEEAAAF